MIDATPLYKVLADAVENHAMAANEHGYRRLLEANEAGNLVVVLDFVPAHQSYCGWNPATTLAWFADATTSPCWDHCDGILTDHRPGWCRTNPAHADLDCMCDVDDFDPPWPESA